MTCEYYCILEYHFDEDLSCESKMNDQKHSIIQITSQKIEKVIVWFMESVARSFV